MTFQSAWKQASSEGIGLENGIELSVDCIVVQVWDYQPTKFTSKMAIEGRPMNLKIAASILKLMTILTFTVYSTAQMVVVLQISQHSACQQRSCWVS